MLQFKTISDAKEYIVRSIGDEALRQGVSLSEVERLMLYFTVSPRSPADIAAGQVSEGFAHEYDSVQYEGKIAELIRSLRKSTKASNRDEFDKWTEAARMIAKEDHYLLVMIAAAGEKPRPPYDQLKLLATALLIVGVLVAVALRKAGFI